MADLGYDGKVAVITGAGGGLGRSHAIYLAGQGARLVVNDVALPAAERVAAEIVAAGGEAIAVAASVTDEAEIAAMVEAAMVRWGRIDILINNAGILRDKSFAKMEMEDFRAVVDVHLIGSANCTKAVWAAMQEQAYGRVLMTASSTGLYGNFGQANYGAAKLGLAGFARTLHLEGVKHDIRVNTIAPTAATRMTEDIFPADLLDMFKPELVAPAALFLVSEDAPTGTILGAGAGVVQAAHVTLTRGVKLDEPTPEAVAANFTAIVDRDGETVPQSGAEQAMTIMQRLQGN